MYSSFSNRENDTIAREKGDGHDSVSSAGGHKSTTHMSPPKQTEMD